MIYTISKKIKVWFVFLFVILFFWLSVHAEDYLNFGQTMKTYFDYVWQDIPESYKYIKLQYKNLEVSSDYYLPFQKWVYLGLFPNWNATLPLTTNINQKAFASLVNKFFSIDASKVSDGYITLTRLNSFLESLNDTDNQSSNQSFSESESWKLQRDIMEHAYNTLKDKFIDSEKVNEDKMRYGAIQWMVKAVWEDYTVFFPPSDAQQFNDEMAWDFEGIGAMVEMKMPWVFVITSPLKDSPAQKAWLLPWDQIKKVDGKEITEWIDANTAVSRIKWQAWTSVMLTIKRWEQELQVSVKRERIIVKNIESEIFVSPKWNICYIWLRMFGNTVASEFDTAMEKFSTKNCVKYIFDLRNNPGWLLDQVSLMLNYFVPTWEPVAIVKSKSLSESIMSDDTKLPKITDWKIFYILINKWSASASEIFAWTMKDYYPESTLIWEKSFGKWSVQELVEYKDWSMLKYTMAKRYTGKSSRWIDKVWITPDVKIVDKTWTKLDEPLAFAKLYFKK